MRRGDLFARFPSAFVIVAAVAVAAACDSNTGPDLTVRTVDVSPAAITIVAGDTLLLTASPRTVDGTIRDDVTVTWQVDDTNVAEIIGSSGLTVEIFARTAGAVTVTAATEGHTGTANVTIDPAPIASIAILGHEGQLEVDETVQLAVELKDHRGNVLTGRAVTWTSSNGQIASVDSTGLVTAHSAGAVTITAAASGHNATTTVEVLAPPSPAPTLTSAEPEWVIAGEPFTLTMRGTNFVASSVIYFNGVARQTTFVNDAVLRANLTAADVPAEGTARAFVFTPPRGGGMTDSVSIIIAPPAPEPTPSLLHGRYLEDAQRLAARELAATDTIDLPAHLVDSYYDALLAVAGSNLAARDSVVRYYGIHTFPRPTMTSLQVGVDTTVAWTHAWRANTRLTGNAAIDDLMEGYAIHLGGFFVAPSVALLEAGVNVNITGLAAAFEQIAGVRFAVPPTITGSGSDIQITWTEQGWLVEYFLRWDGCPAGCMKERHWSFRVDAGEVTFLGSDGDPAPPPHMR